MRREFCVSFFCFLLFLPVTMAFTGSTAQESSLVPARDAGGVFSNVDSVQNRLTNVISDDPNYEEFVPNEMDDFFSDNQIPSGIGPLTSFDLQEIESLGNENREEGTSSSCPDLVEEDDHALVEKYLCDSNSSAMNINPHSEIESVDYGWLTDQLNPPHVEESRRENLNTHVVLSNKSEEIEHMDHGNLRADEERVNNDLVTLNSSYSEEIGLKVDKQMHVNETTTVDHNFSRGVKRTERKCGITLKDLQQQFGKKVEDAARSLGVSRSTFKRICRAYGIVRWSRKKLVQQTATLTQSMATICDQRDNSMSIKASYNGVNVKFPLSLSSGKSDLEFEVEKRFGIRTGSFRINYEDEEKELIRITCDEDLHHGMRTCMGRGITTMKMLVN